MSEGKENTESSVPVSYFVDSIVTEFLNRSDDDFMGTGLIAFDRVTGGLKNGEFLIITGLRGIGKTVLMIEIANHWANKNKTVVFFSLTESPENITKKFLANIGRLSPGFFNKEWGSQEANIKLLNAAKILKTNPIYIYKNLSLHLSKLIVQIRKSAIERKAQIIFIDCLELIIVGELYDSKVNNRAIICEQLKLLAIELDIVLIVSSRLPINSYTSIEIGSAPEYYDLVLKGFIEPNTDTVIVHRSDYFGIETDENKQSTKNRMKLIIAKYSTGVFIEVPVKTAFDKTAIMDLDYT